MKKVLRFLGFFISGLLIVAGLVLAGFYIWLNAYLKGDEFRTMVATETSHSLQLKGDYLPFHWAGFSVHSDGFYGTGLGSTPVTSARADQIRADLNLRPILSGVWNLSRIDIQSLQVEINPAAAPSPSEESTAMTATTSVPTKPSFFARFLPSRVQIDSVSITSVNILLKTTPAVTVSDLQVLLTPNGNTWTIDAVNGKLQQPDWPPFTIQRAKLRATALDLFLTEIILQLKEGGQIAVSGEINSRENGPIRLQADVQRAPLTAFLTGDWRARLVGFLNGPVKWTGDLHGPNAIQANGSLRLLEGRIEALPFLNQIAVLTKTEEFRSLKLHKASADFIWLPKTNRLEVNNLILESEGLVRVQGKFVVENNLINGKFSIGTTPAVLKYVAGAESQVFTDKHDGYIWAPLNLTGPVNSPKDDLTPKLQAAAINAVGEAAQDGLQKVIDAAKSLLPF